MDFIVNKVWTICTYLVTRRCYVTMFWSMWLRLKTYRDQTSHRSSSINSEKKCDGLLPNIWFSLRVLLTLLVTEASGERRFSKLMLNKTYLRYLSPQLCLKKNWIEIEIGSQLDLPKLIEQCAQLKALKIQNSTYFDNKYFMSQIREIKNVKNIFY